MTASDTPPLRSEILAEASRWFVDLNEHPQDERTRQAFDHWLRRSPEHVHAFLQISAHWEEGTPREGAQTESVDVLIELAKADTNIVHFAGAGPVPHTASKGSLRRVSHTFRRRRLAWVASVLLCLAALLSWQHFFRGVYSTAIGEQRSLTLADGSTVDLNSRTRIRVSYTSRERRIDLLEGQALFHVAKNESQPFVVRSADTLVRAVGTQFDVYRKKMGTVVTVVEGRVAVVSLAAEGNGRGATVPAAGAADLRPAAAPSSEPRKAARFLNAGQQITVSVDAAIPAQAAQLEPSGLEAATAWTQRRLIFKATPLAEVIGEFNRYSERPIVISDPEIAAIPISGSFSSSSPADLMRFLREVGGYEVQETPSAIRISRK